MLNAVHYFHYNEEEEEAKEEEARAGRLCLAGRRQAVVVFWENFGRAACEWRVCDHLRAARMGRRRLGRAHSFQSRALNKCGTAHNSKKPNECPIERVHSRPLAAFWRPPSEEPLYIMGQSSCSMAA